MGAPPCENFIRICSTVDLINFTNEDKQMSGSYVNRSHRTMNDLEYIENVVLFFVLSQGFFFNITHLNVQKKKNTFFLFKGKRQN